MSAPVACRYLPWTAMCDHCEFTIYSRHEVTHTGDGKMLCEACGLAALACIACHKPLADEEAHIQHLIDAHAFEEECAVEFTKYAEERHD